MSETQTKILKKRKSPVRTVCVECKQGIRVRDLYTMVDGEARHLYCAADAGAVKPCPECFLLGGQCSCEID